MGNVAATKKGDGENGTFYLQYNNNCCFLVGNCRRRGG